MMRPAVARPAMIVVLLFSVATASWAEGSNTTSPAPTPPTPTPVVTSLPALNAVGQGGCAQQYTGAINALSQNALTADKVGLASEAAGLVANSVAFGADEVAQSAVAATWATGGAAMIAGGATLVGTPAGVVAGGVAMEAAAASNATQAVATAAKIVALGTQAVGLASQTTATVFSQSQQDLVVYVATLPNCEAEFTGTVTVSGGGLNVTGGSIFNDDVGVAGNVNVEGDVNASQVHATQGISADGGAIWLGDPNGTTYSDGITLGGGALSGAGVGGAQAFTGDVDAIAIGNNAEALLPGSLALGRDASSTGEDATAIGNAAVADADDATAIGTNAQANAAGSAAYGQGAVANLTQQQVFGTTDNTYTTPGITSARSRVRQHGPLEVANTDSAGNLATDGGQIYRTLSENQAGIAISMALAAPAVLDSESFAVALNWGGFNQSHALGFSALGVVARDVLGVGERISLTAGFGLSLNEKEFGGRSADTQFGGRAGVQLSW